MALLHTHFYSQVLGCQAAMDVVLPEPASRTLKDSPAVPALHPCLWLLHGLSDDHTIWQRRTSIERYVDGTGLAVIMPSVARSFYTDMHHGGRYWTFISEELPAVSRSLFPLSPRREDNFAAGLSMGGYGAFKLALRYPERYCAAASLSGVLDLGRAAVAPDWVADMRLVFGDPASVSGSENDLLALAGKVASMPAALRPRLFQWCGTEDFLYTLNLTFRDHALSLGLPLIYSESPGNHSWACWDAQIQRVLAWMPLASRAANA